MTPISNFAQEQHPKTNNRLCKRTQHESSNNVASACTWLNWSWVRLHEGFCTFWLPFSSILVISLAFISHAPCQMYCCVLAYLRKCQDSTVEPLHNGRLSSLSEKTVESLTDCKYHYKGSTFFSVTWRPWDLVRLGFEPMNSRSAHRRSLNWANQAAVNHICKQNVMYISKIFGAFHSINTEGNFGKGYTSREI